VRYQTDVNENKFIIKGDGQAEDGGVGINKEAIQFWSKLYMPQRAF